ncbi:MAG: dihydrofolate reductase family protein [Nitriliruptoraceae bacterium]
MNSAGNEGCGPDERPDDAKARSSAAVIGTPRVGRVNADEAYVDLTLEPGTTRPHVALGMVAAADGASAIDGASGQLGGSGDFSAFRRLRDAADVILVGARTVIAEDYRPPVPDASRQADRVARGLAAVPRLAILTRSVGIDPSARVFSDPAHLPIVLVTGSVSARAHGDIAPVAEVVELKGDHVTIETALDALWHRGLRRLLCEGGPTVNNLLLCEDLIDEMFITVTPLAVGGPAPRIIAGPHPSPARPFDCSSVTVVGNEVLLRYRRNRLVDGHGSDQ